MNLRTTYNHICLPVSNCQSLMHIANENTLPLVGWSTSPDSSLPENRERLRTNQILNHAVLKIIRVHTLFNVICLSQIQPRVGILCFYSYCISASHSVISDSLVINFFALACKRLFVCRLVLHELRPLFFFDHII